MDDNTVQILKWVVIFFLVGCSATLAYLGKEGWEWFLFVALLIG